MLLLESFPAEILEHFREGVVPQITESIRSFGPEFQVAIAAMVILLLDLVISRKSSKHLAWLAILACVFPTISHLDRYPTF